MLVRGKTAVATLIKSGFFQELTAQTAFVTLSYINIIRIPMAMLPFMIIGMVQVSVSLGRLNKFINNEEIDAATVDHRPKDFADEAIRVEKGQFRSFLHSNFKKIKA